MSRLGMALTYQLVGRDVKESDQGIRPCGVQAGLARIRDMSSLANMKCAPCRGGVPPLTAGEIAPLKAQVPGWKVVKGHHLNRLVPTADFAESLALANRIGALAEKAGHHPDLLVA